MILKNQPVTEEELREILQDYPTKDYLEERFELFEKGIVQELDERMDKRFKNFEENMDEKLEKLQKNILSALGSTVVNNEQRIIKLEEAAQLTR